MSSPPVIAPSARPADLPHARRSPALRGVCTVPGDKSISHRATSFSTFAETLKGLGASI